MLDADIYGPSQPTMLGISGRPESTDGKTLEPLEAYGVQAMSIGFLIDADTPMVWRGPMVTQALEQLLKDTDWRELDYLIVDMPPGTGDIQLTLAQKVPVTGAVIVTTPQDIALIDARKGLKMFEKVGVPIVGIVENMSIHVCSNCGHAEHIFGAGRRARRCAGTTTCRSWAAAARHPHPRAGRLRAADGRRRSRRQGGADLSRDRAQGGGVGRAEGRGLLRQVPEHRHPEHVRRAACARVARRSLSCRARAARRCRRARAARPSASRKSAPSASRPCCSMPRARRIVTAGVAREAGSPIAADTEFEIGSVTKTFTSLLLAERWCAARPRSTIP